MINVSGFPLCAARLRFQGANLTEEGMTSYWAAVCPADVMLTALEVTRVASIYPDAAVHISRAILAERNKYVWQAIEGAPKDGTIIDLYTSMGVVCLNEWWIEEDGEAFWSCDFDDRFVTHWRPVMPLPSLQEPSTKPPIKEAAES